ncbi:MAG: hypothetical protein HOH14_02050 [Gammaproteobacteria bacterium]|jgi:hypothetical protein|nr:hypothetical protein [Gammaproteobacteria bacterium]
MNIQKSVIKMLLGAILSSAAVFASAHHGWSWYGNSAFILTAEVIDVDFGNPHDSLILKDADGQQWNVLLSPPARSRRAGLDDEKVNVGDTVTAYGHRRSEGDNFEMKTERLKVGEKIFNLYPDRR